MTLAELARALVSAEGIRSKKHIQVPATELSWVVPGPWGSDVVRLGDDCAAIPDGEGFLLFAAEGMLPEFVEQEPRAAGYCSVLVNASDVYSMGGRPLAVVDAIFSQGPAAATHMLEGMRRAAADLGIAIVGGHSNLKSPYAALAVAIVGRARSLLTSFDAKPGDQLVAVFDLRGRLSAGRPFFDATRGAPPARMRADYEVLPLLAERGLCTTAKDISMGGLFGTLLMLLESSGVGATLNVDAVPCPLDADVTRWLQTFPSYGFLLAVAPQRSEAVLSAFAARELSAAVVGAIDASRTLSLAMGGERALVWDLSNDGLTRPVSSGSG